MEEDIQNHSPTVMFGGTPCSSSNDYNEKPKLHFVTYQRYLNL